MRLGAGSVNTHLHGPHLQLGELFGDFFVDELAVGFYLEADIIVPDDLANVENMRAK